jgi:hypothetical protein
MHSNKTEKVTKTEKNVIGNNVYSSTDNENSENSSVVADYQIVHYSWLLLPVIKIIDLILTIHLNPGIIALLLRPNI